MITAFRSRKFPGHIAVLVLFVAFLVSQGEVDDLSAVVNAVLITSTVMLIVGLLACVEPARRALRIHPTDALKEA